MSTNRPWYKRYPSDFIQGTVGLSLEEKGAYSLILDLIYDKGAPIVDDARYLAGICNVSLRKWAAIRERLISAKKITVLDGFISNFRAEKEIENATKLERKLVENGAKGGRKRAENLSIINKNKDLSLAPLKHTCAKEEDIERDIKKDTNVSSKKGCRLPEDFQPDFSIAFSEGFTEQQAQKLFENFKDYWTAKTGKDATKRDWQATWRNWVRSPFSQKFKGNGHARTNTDNRSTARQFTEAILNDCRRKGVDPFKPIIGGNVSTEVPVWGETNSGTDCQNPLDDERGARLALVASNTR